MATEKKEFDRNSVNFYADVLDAYLAEEITEEEYKKLLFPDPEEEEEVVFANTSKDRPAKKVKKAEIIEEEAKEKPKEKEEYKAA